MTFAAKTRVPADRTRNEIERLLERHKAQQYGTAVDYQARTARVQFRLHDRIVRFAIALPDGDRQKERYAQEERRLWRALLLVIKAKLESVESGIATFEDEFLARIVLPDDRTVGEHVTPLVAAAYKLGKMPEQLALPSAKEGQR